MVSKNVLKQLAQLGQKKFRQQRGFFAVEGRKAIETFYAHGFEMAYCFSLEPQRIHNVSAVIISASDMKKLSNLTTPPQLWAAFTLPKPQAFAVQNINIALDGIRDPGNLGTIIRLCDWFGVQHILCSLDTVDCYNPKVVQASMGSLANVHVHYGHLPEMFLKHNLIAVGTSAKGENMYKAALPSPAVFVLGNEGQGISEAVASHVDHNIRIPSLGNPAAESLNVAMATAIVLSEYTRKGGLFESKP